MNRAREFLLEALGLMQYGRYAQAETVVCHALREVYELEQMAGQVTVQLEMQPPQETGVRLIRAFLNTGRERKALEG